MGRMTFFSPVAGGRIRSLQSEKSEFLLPHSLVLPKSTTHSLDRGDFIPPPSPLKSAAAKMGAKTTELGDVAGGDMMVPREQQPDERQQVEKEDDNNVANLEQIQNQKVEQQKLIVRFREKQFTIRPALLEKYFDVDHGEYVVLYTFFVAIFVLATMATWAQDYHRHGNPFHHFWLIAWNFRKLPQALLLWSAMFASTILIPFGALRISTSHSQFFFGSAKWTRIAVGATYVAYQLAFFYYSICAIFWLNLEGACSFIITCENTRIAMKTHSFFRENFSRNTNSKNSNNKSINQSQTAEGQGQQQQQQHVLPFEWPPLSHYIYFMFCPTFLYRDAYPRSPSRSWLKVGRHFGACLASMYFVSICFSQWIIPHFAALSYPEDIRWHLLVASIFPSIIPGAISLFLGIFYGLLHSWLSMFAEALQFGDRHFYSNWWSSRNMAEYYRNWNLVVHDWLYAYVYRDLSMFLGRKWGPPVSQVLVFFLSSFFHEYWFTVSLRMFYPVIFTLYFIFGGVFFLFSKLIKKPYVWNTLMWWNLLIGTGMFTVCYATEWYARQRCVRIYESDFLDFLIPRSWMCRRNS